MKYTLILGLAWVLRRRTYSMKGFAFATAADSHQMKNVTVDFNGKL